MRACRSAGYTAQKGAQQVRHIMAQRARGLDDVPYGSCRGYHRLLLLLNEYQAVLNRAEVSLA